MTLRASVVEALAGHGITASPEDAPAPLRARLNEVYLDDVRALKARQRSGEIPLSEYVGHVEALRRRYPLLSLPLPHWEQPPA